MDSIPLKEVYNLTGEGERGRRKIFPTKSATIGAGSFLGWLGTEDTQPPFLCRLKLGGVAVCTYFLTIKILRC